MPSMDVFRSDAFSVVSLTDAINKAPYQPGRIGFLGLFTERGIMTTTVVIEEKSGQLKLIQTSPRGSSGGSLGASKRKVRSFVVPHLEEVAAINADEVQNIRAWGSETETQTVQGLVDERLAELRALHEVTLEYHRIKALQGIILDADGSVLFNLFTEFGVAQQTYELGSGASVRSDCTAIQRKIEGALGASQPIGGGNGPVYRAFCGDTFFDTFIEDTSVKTSLQYQESALLRADLRHGFEYGGIAWENYRGRLGADLADPDDDDKDVDGDAVTPFVADDEAYVVPMVANLCKTYFAPADYEETVNRQGLPIYAKQSPDKWNKLIEIQSQSNPLCLVLRPRAIVKVTLAT